MSTMEQALRDEIAWLWRMLEGCRPSLLSGFATEFKKRIDALTAALPAPGVEVPEDWVMVPRVATREMLNDGAGALNETPWMDEMAKAWDAMIEIAPSAPAEISQAQAQAMREALERAGHALTSAASWMVPECDGHRDALAAADRARLAALTPEPPR